MTAREIAVLDRIATDLIPRSDRCPHFWACPGPTKRPVNMLTCHVCRAIYNLNRFIRRRRPCRVGIYSTH
jgi:hypothetical protein